MTSTKPVWLRAVALLVPLALCHPLLAADANVKNLRQFNADDRTVDMFDAIAAKEIDVKLIPKNEKLSRVFIKNNTDQPLNVKLPEAFAGVPVLAQLGRGGGTGGGGGSQSMGGGMGGGMMGGGGMGGGGMGGGGGMFNVAPEQVGQFKVATVCLEHGKDEPRPNIPYEIRPLDTVTTEPGVKEVLVALGTGKLNQQAAQAAAWHLANGMSWQQLAGKRIEHLNGTSESWFSPQEIHVGMQVAAAAVAVAQAKATAPTSPGETETSFQQAISLD